MGKPRPKFNKRLVDSDLAAWGAICAKHELIPIALLCASKGSGGLLTVGLLHPEGLSPTLVAQLLIDEAQALLHGSPGEKELFDVRGEFHGEPEPVPERADRPN